MKDDYKLDCTLDCPELPRQTSATPLAEQILEQLNELQSDRIMSFVRAARKPQFTNASTLERDVDALLDSVNDLHRLQQLAVFTARGGSVTVEADRFLIATHADTFQALVARHAERSGVRLPDDGLLPSYPRSIE